MRVYVFAEEIAGPKNCYRPERIRTVLEKAAEATDTGDLVVAVYLLSKTAIWGGLMVTGCLSRPDFHHGSGRDWAFVRRFRPPEDLPEQYKLIRMVLSVSARYPTTTKDTHTAGGYDFRVLMITLPMCLPMSYIISEDIVSDCILEKESNQRVNGRCSGQKRRVFRSKVSRFASGKD